MFRNYFITAFRYIIRNRFHSIIQIVSLTVGITAIFLIGLYVNNELSHDKFNEKFDRIYRLEYGYGAGLPTAIGHQIKENISEVENVVRMVKYGDGTTRLRYISDQGRELERKIELKVKYAVCDSSVFDVFTLPFIQGDLKTALRDPNTVVLTESTAREIFGNKDPVGEVIDLLLTNNRSYTITGVIQDVEDFHIEIDILLSMVSLREWDSIVAVRWGERNWLNAYNSGNLYFTYLLLHSHKDLTRTEKIVTEFFRDRMKDKWFYSEEYAFSLRPLKEIYFCSPLENEYGYCRHGNLKLLKILFAIAIFILILACINYINLTTARASLRAREVGIRKVAGSLKSRLMAQFLVEPILMSLVSFLIAIALAKIALPTFNQLAMTELSLEGIVQPGIILLSLAGILLLGFIAGIYPAVYMTSFQPVDSIKGKQLTGVRSILFRRILLTFQFTISVVLMIGVLTILRQLKFMKTADLGFDKELVVNIPHYGMHNDFQKRQVFKEKMLQNPNIKKVAFGSVPGGVEQTIPNFLECNGIIIRPNMLNIDPDYFGLMGIELLQGRNFSWDVRGGGSVIINETARREYDLVSPIGEIINSERGWSLKIIGVVKDFHFVSLHHKIEPYIYQWWGNLNGVSIKILSTNIQGTLDYIQNEVESMFPEDSFEYSFLDESFNQQYENDERLARIISNFAIVAILIACLGLFGLSTFIAARRTKEIGIRKTMGASIRTVFLLLAREFAVWVTLSVIVACPVAWIIMNRWLQGFAYRTHMSAWIFILAIVIAFSIAFLTVAWQSLKTARTNPVEALRYE